jgi:hypothetical protein
MNILELFILNQLHDVFRTQFDSVLCNLIYNNIQYKIIYNHLLSSWQNNYLYISTQIAYNRIRIQYPPPPSRLSYPPVCVTVVDLLWNMCQQPSANGRRRRRLNHGRRNRGEYNRVSFFSYMV